MTYQEFKKCIEILSSNSRAIKLASDLNEYHGFNAFHFTGSRGYTKNSRSVEIEFFAIDDVEIRNFISHLGFNESCCIVKEG